MRERERKNPPKNWFTQCLGQEVKAGPPRGPSAGSRRPQPPRDCHLGGWRWKVRVERAGPSLAASRQACERREWAGTGITAKSPAVPENLLLSTLSCRFRLRWREALHTCLARRVPQTLLMVLVLLGQVKAL